MMMKKRQSDKTEDCWSETANRLFLITKAQKQHIARQYRHIQSPIQPNCIITFLPFLQFPYNETKLL